MIQMLTTKVKDNFHLFNHKLGTFMGPIWITLIFTTVTSLLHYKFQYLDIWSPLKDAVGNATLFCELNRFGQLIVQPSNTYSNVGFLFVACVILSIAYRDHKYTDRKSVNNLLAQYPGFSFLMGFSCLVLFFGSFFYHASLTWGFQKLDQTAMYFLITSFFAYNIFKIFPTIRKKESKVSSHKTIIFIALIVMALFYFVLWKIGVMIIFPTLIISFFISNLVSNKILSQKFTPYKIMLKALVVTFLSASFIWIMDITDVLCIPTSLLQGHALWHFLCAASILITYLYFRGEKFLFINFKEENIADQGTL